MKPISLLFILIPISVYAQSNDDSYTRYELLDPATQSFRILYEVTATTPGSGYYYNTLRKGSEHKVDGVTDPMTGRDLTWSIVTGDEAKKSGYAEAQPGVDYLKIKLARPITAGSEYRLLIDKTYKDVKSYFTQGDRIVFDRGLGIKRNSVVLPKGYELVKCNYPAQVVMENDGRIKISFLNVGSAEVPLHIEGRKLPGAVNLVVEKTTPASPAPGEGRDKSKARVNFSFAERAHQTREIVYFLQQPETHSFRLYHDYTEVLPGMDRYINIVRPGSKASNPSAKLLDTGEALKVETLKGDAISKMGLNLGEPITAEMEVVVIWYDHAILPGESRRLRIEETYTDPDRYVLNKDELVFDRSFGRPFNTVIMPEGWFLTGNIIPATIDLTADGKISLEYVNPGPDEIDVLITGRRR